ncbi:MAG: hypothetical protein IJF59_02625, partial [Clostridia bacterium]|nr:hypothetical protein [Clostridia bacterium]
MSFTAEVKAELAALSPAAALLTAECYGMVLPSVQPGGGRIRLLTESVDAAKRMAVLCEGLCGAAVELSASGNGYAAEVEQDTGAVEQVLAALDIQRDAPALRLGRAQLEEEGAAAAFLRGLFLAVGAVSDPEKGYRLELVVRYRRLAGDVAVLLE